MMSYGKILRDWPKRPMQKKVVMPLFIVFVLALFFVWEQVTYSELAMEANQLQQKRNKLYELNQYLRAEVDCKKGFEIIEKKAQKELGMHFPKEGPIILVVSDNNAEISLTNTVIDFWEIICSLFDDER